MNKSPRKTIGGITLSMFGIGVGIALVAVLSGAWISATIVPELGAAEEEVVTSYTPLAFLSVTALGAPIVAGIVGLTRSEASETTRDAAVIGVACLVGATLMVLVAGVGIAFSEPTGPQEVDNGDSSDGGENSDNASSDQPTVLDIVGLAGLCGVGALVSGFVTARFGG